MKLLFNIRLLCLLGLIVIVGALTSCDKNDDNGTDSGKVELLSFGPTGSQHGDTIKFIGYNLDKITEVDFTGGAKVMQNAFIKSSKDVFYIVVPDAALEGFVTLKTPTGDIVSKTIFNMNVLPIITSMTKESRPGDNVTITGKYLDWVDSIAFSIDKRVTTFVSKSLTQLVVKVPADAQTGKLILYYRGTKASFYETDSTVKVTLPVVTSMAPNPVLHATNVTITGTNLDLTKKVYFNSVTAPVTSFVSQSATQLVVKVPGGTTKGKLTLEAASGVKTVSTMDLDVILPTITTMSPNPVDPNTNLTVTGTNLDLVTSVSFVGALSPVTSFVSQSVTQIVVTVPTGVLKGKISLAVLNSSLIVQSSNDLDITGGLPPLADFPLPIYTDALQNTFQDWSYTTTHDFNSTANVRQGTKSIKSVYDAGNGYQGTTFHAGTAVSTTGYTLLEFSVFGEAGTDGKKINLVINGNYGGPTQVTIVAGAWTTFSLPLSGLGSPATIGEIVLQSAGWGGTIHIDHVGLR